jgi:hypothetical protein
MVFEERCLKRGEREYRESIPSTKTTQRRIYYWQPTGQHPPHPPPLPSRMEGRSPGVVAVVEADGDADADADGDGDDCNAGGTGPAHTSSSTCPASVNFTALFTMFRRICAAGVGLWLAS